MKYILDESVSYGLAEVLRNKGYSVTAIAESSTTGIADTEVFKLAVCCFFASTFPYLFARYPPA
ncbi:MAG: DUF5615 family PIN-like protein [Nitrospirae bacterium]|nr:DUF5615 family PIN-like protein [Nitrospirota bacterium]